MSSDEVENGGRLFFQSEVFKDGPRTRSHTSIADAQGIEVFGGAAAAPTPA